MQKEKNSVKYKYLLLMALFGSMGPFVKAVGLPSPVTACFRAIVAFIFLGLYLLVTKHKYDKSQIRKNFLPMVIAGLFLSGDWIGLFESYNYTSVAVATVCYYTTPIFICLGSAVFLKEKFTLKHIVCAVIAFIGVFFVSGIMKTGITGSSAIKGILFSILGAISYASVVIINKRFPEGDRYLRTEIQIGTTAIFSSIYILFAFKGLSIALDFRQIASLLVLGIGLTAFTYIKYFKYVLQIPSRTVAIFSYADPLVAVIVSVLLMGETMTIWEVIGAVLIIGSAVVSEN